MTPSYPHTRHWPESLTVHRDDHYHADPTRFLGREVVITEKLDGGVTTISDKQVYARSSDLPTHEPWFSYVKARTLPKFYPLDANFCVIGEDLYGVHSIEYDPLPDSFFLFHVLERDIENIDQPETTGDRFWSWDGVVAMAQEYDVLTVPALYRGKFETLAEITEFFMDNIGKPSIYGPIREGFVMRDTDGFAFDEFETCMCKFVRANHVQTDEHWTRNWRPARMMK